MLFNVKYKKTIGNSQLMGMLLPFALFRLPLALCLLLITSCHNHTEGDVHNHSTTQTTPEANVEEHTDEAPATIASLTDEQIKTVGITYGNVEMKELTATIKANGNLKVPNNNKGNATSLYGGVIKSLNVQIGSYVHKGQAIATIANPQFIQLQEEYLMLSNISGSENISINSNSNYSALILEKNALVAQIDYAQKEYARQKELFEGNAGARKNLEAAQANLNSLNAKMNTINGQLSIFSKSSNNTNNVRLASVKQQLIQMGIEPTSINSTNLKSTLVVKSPISGTVSNLFAKIGSYVDVTSPVAEIVDNESLHLDLNVFEKDLPMLKVGQIIHFTLTNNPTNEYDAVVYSIGTAFENDSKTIPVHCNVKDNKTGLIDGMNITGIVSLNNATTPAVPNDAIVEADGKYYIFIITNKKPEEHHEQEATEHDHKETEKGKKAEPNNTTNFEKIEVLKGVSNMGYTAITFVTEIPTNAKIVTKGAFFINAKLTNQGEAHEH